MWTSHCNIGALAMVIDKPDRPSGPVQKEE